MEHASRGRRSGNKGVGARWRGRFPIFSARHCSRTEVSHAENSGMTMIFLIPAPRPATSHRPPYRHSGIFRRGASRDGKYPESPAPAGRKSARPRNNSQGYPTTPPTIPPKHRHSGHPVWRQPLLREGRLKVARGRSWQPEIGMEHASRGRRSGNKGVGARWRGRFRIFSARHRSRTKVSHAENSGMTMLFFSWRLLRCRRGILSHPLPWSTHTPTPEIPKENQNPSCRPLLRRHGAA